MRKNSLLPNSFSEREQEVFQLLLQGLSNKEIASTLGICQKTVEKHLANIYIKIGASSRAEAIVWYLEKGRDFPT
ncbi:MAG: hypothetical protein CO064_01460 [Anaerolineae bacterium CG_4_9_14_0_8_um_filter_58_9]|nr:MAG: hypothetical protein CO064_01460 [Anaerolineae bacterium CG_4_9_14_0_8_um_filter_58_9]